jgi:2-polyprenyl-3-methyl-5-hydroxy-6-metoxy-1,4-benzoquinol methylase
MNSTVRQTLSRVDDTMPDLAVYLYSQIAHFLGDRVIDAGAGVGSYSRLMQGDGKQVVALEGDPQLAMILRSRLTNEGDEVYECDLGDTNGLPEFAPAQSAVCINVAEHVKYDDLALRNLRERVTPGGSLVLGVPAHPWLFNGLDRCVGHYRRYTREGLISLLARTGWKTQSITYFNALSILPWFVSGTLLRRNTFDPSLISVAGVVMPAMNWFDAHVARGRIGISLVAVATNPGTLLNR